MTTPYYSIILASTYGEGAYNSANYNGTNVTNTTTGGSTGSGSGGTLTNTGVAVAAIVTIAALILLTAMAVRIWKRPGKSAQSKTKAEPSTVD